MAELALLGRKLAEVAVRAAEIAKAPLVAGRTEGPPKVKISEGRASIAGARTDGSPKFKMSEGRAPIAGARMD